LSASFLLKPEGPELFPEMSAHPSIKRGFSFQKIPIICYFENQVKLQCSSKAENICQSSVEITYLQFPVYTLKNRVSNLKPVKLPWSNPTELTSIHFTENLRERKEDMFPLLDLFSLRKLITD
jgi:hypothetical protein